MMTQFDSVSYKPTQREEVSRMVRVTVFWIPTFLPNVYGMLDQAMQYW
jgi:hypothetical protein